MVGGGGVQPRLGSPQLLLLLHRIHVREHRSGRDHLPLFDQHVDDASRDREGRAHGVTRAQLSGQRIIPRLHAGFGDDDLDGERCRGDLGAGVLGRGAGRKNENCGEPQHPGTSRAYIPDPAP